MDFFRRKKKDPVEVPDPVPSEADMSETSDSVTRPAHNSLFDDGFRYQTVS